VPQGITGTDGAVTASLGATVARAGFLVGVRNTSSRDEPTDDATSDPEAPVRTELGEGGADDEFEAAVDASDNESDGGGGHTTATPARTATRTHSDPHSVDDDNDAAVGVPLPLPAKVCATVSTSDGLGMTAHPVLSRSWISPSPW